MINHKEVTIITVCPFCGHANEIAVNAWNYWDWKDGMNVRDAFPYLSAEEREMLISGICPKCWAKTFSSDKEDEYYEPDVDESFYDPFMGCDFYE